MLKVLRLQHDTNYFENRDDEKTLSSSDRRNRKKNRPYNLAWLTAIFRFWCWPHHHISVLSSFSSIIC